tara:strand:- start:303 stop:2324 length:2022 start_codon:yes stop_codon:yes gene_type:complete
MAYNLLGQQGTKGERNPDPNLSDAEATYLYDTPPGFGDNKGLTKTSFGTLGPADKRTHNKKLQEVGIEPDLEKELSSVSFAEKPTVEAKVVLPPATTKEINNVRSILDFAQLAFKKNISDSQKNKLIGAYKFDRQTLDNLILAGDKADEINFVEQLKEEDVFIRNIVNNNIAIAKAEAEKRDTRSLVQKETDFIKEYVEKKNKGVDPGSVNYIEQLNEEMDYITNFVNNRVKPKLIDKQNTNKNNDKIVDEIVNETATETVTESTNIVDNNLGTQQQTEGAQQSNQEFISFVNIPRNGLLFSVDNNLFIAYEVPGLGTFYEGSSMYLAYEVPNNNLVDAGILPPGMAEPTANVILPKTLFDKIAVVTGNTDQLTADIDNPFASFVETISEQAQVAPWITDREMLQLIAEAAVEGRTVSDAEWQSTNWYQTHSEPEREWLRTFYADPSTAAQTITDGQIAVGNALQAAGVSNAPEALVNWVADKFVTGQWTQNYTTEQISLFADPYAEGKRDTDFESYLTSTAITGVDRTSQREAEVRQLYSQYLGPVLGKITDGEAAEIAGKLRNDPDYKDQLVAGLKQSRLAAFSAYTNPELTYEDIARPWRNLTASVWGQTADETQGWWQDMIKTNDFAQAEETLRTKGLELDITQVTQDATTALSQALGQGNISQLGVNV